VNFISFRDVLTACLQLDDLKGKKKKKGKKKIEPLDTSTIGEDVYKVPQEQEISISDVQGEAPVKAPQKEVRLKLPEEDSSAFSELFSLPPKKKRRRQNITFEGFDIEEAVTTDGLAGEGQAEGVDDELEDLKQKMPWLVSDRDYSYEELLERAFKLITRNNPSMTGGRQKVVMKPPQVIRVGRKTAFANFAEISKMLHREPKHLMSFLMAELGTIGSVDGNNQLIIKGVFQQKNVESVLKKYIKEYVTCHTCRSPDTILQREIRLTFLQCERCGSRCSVQNIRTGFVAVTNRVTMRMRQT
jgi:translation initiation factor 2 subunit 2